MELRFTSHQDYSEIPAISQDKVRDGGGGDGGGGGRGHGRGDGRGRGGL